MSEPRRSMSARVVVVTVTGLLASAALPVGPANAASKPPVVTVTLKDGAIKISGAKGLKAGWVTFHVINRGTEEEGIILSVDRHPTTKASNAPASAPPSIRRMAPHNAAGEAGPTAQETYAQDADSARSSEKAIDWLGGINAVDSRGVDLTVKLPAGTIVLGAGLNAVPIKVAKGTNHGAPGHATVSVSEGRDSVIHAPSTLPRDGVLRISDNDSGVRTHFIMLIKPPKGATTRSIEKSFGLSDRYSAATQFDSYPVTGYFNPLSAGHTEYESYHHLKPGRYAFIDTYADDKTGHIHAQDGAVTFVTVK